MYKLSAIIVLLYGVFDEINAIQNATIARELKLSQPYSTTIANDSHLLTISTNITHLQINSTDQNFKSCSIAVDPVERFLRKKIHAKTLGSKIIVWGLRSKYANESVVTVNYTILITDPLQCTYKVLPTVEEVLAPYWPKTNGHTTKTPHDGCSYNPPSTADETFPSFWFERLPQLVIRDQNTFDVFYPSLAICAPCRYSSDGTRINLDRRIKPETPRAALFTQIEAFDLPGHERGYFYANGFGNDTAVVKLLDRDFNVVREKFINHSVDVAAVSTGISVCYMTSRPFPFYSYIFGSDGKSANHIYCEGFNDNLESKFSTELVLPDKVEPRSLTLNVDSSGNLFVSVQSSNLNQEDIFVVYHFNSEGALINTSNLAQIKNTDLKSWNPRGLLTDNQYCLEITLRLSNATSNDDECIKCIAI